MNGTISIDDKSFRASSGGVYGRFALREDVSRAADGVRPVDRRELKRQPAHLDKKYAAARA